MILLLLIFIAIILLFGAAAVKAGLGKGFFVLLAILAVGGIIVSLSGEVDREEALPIFICVTLTFLFIIALVCFIGFKILTRGTQSGEIPSKSHKQKTILIHILLWCATAVSLFFSINFFTKHYHYGYNSMVNGIIFLIPAILLCPLVVMRLIKQSKFRIISIVCGLAIFAGYLFVISSDAYYWSDGFIQHRQTQTSEQIESLFSDYSLDADAETGDKYCNQVTVICPDIENCTDNELISIGNALQDYDEFSLECSVVSGENTYMFVTDYPDKLTITKNGEQIYPQEQEILQNSTSSNDNKSGDYWCIGKNDTCQNKTDSPDDFFCDECDPNRDNIEG